MNVAIVHYHLGRGGVSTVIERTSRILTENGIRHVILVDAPPDPVVGDLPVRIVRGLGYGRETEPAGWLETLRSTAADALGSPPDLWHFHNHSLGKNPRMAELVARLAEDGERLVLHIHDLAEDGRPQNLPMLAECRRPYPFSPAIRYVFLNSRDRRVFTRAGLPGEQSHLLANPIPDPEPVRERPAGPPLVFAPVRGIRRKNLGELVLLSAIAPPGARFAASRAPLDPAALAIHDNWRDFASDRQLPMGFDVVDRFSPVAGAEAGFESWIRHASHFVSTSVREGFGLAFLEAAAYRKPLIGRRIATVADDLDEQGIHPGELYEKLLVPLGWIDEPLLRDHLRTTLERNHRFSGTPLPTRACDDVLDHLVRDGWLDFGNLPEPLQQAAIERLVTPSAREIPRVVVGGKTLSASAWLDAALRNRTPSTDIRQLAPYAPEKFGSSLVAIYQEVTGGSDGPLRFLPPSQILAAYQNPASFHFLLSAPPPPVEPPPPYKAVIFDIYGTLLAAPAGGVIPDPLADPLIREVLRQAGCEPPASPSTTLHAAVLRHHAAAGVPHPEIDLRELWREVLGLEPGTDTTGLVKEIEAVWHPCRPIPGAAGFVRRLARQGVSIGLLSNAQCNTLGDLGEIRDLFPTELVVLSYRQGIAKPSPELFALMAERLANRGITPGETLFIGNDPLQDIVPAAAAGFATALFTGHPDSLRDGECNPDFEIRSWRDAPW